MPNASQNKEIDNSCRCCCCWNFDFEFVICWLCCCVVWRWELKNIDACLQYFDSCEFEIWIFNKPPHVIIPLLYGCEDRDPERCSRTLFYSGSSSLLYQGQFLNFEFSIFKVCLFFWFLSLGFFGFCLLVFVVFEFWVLYFEFCLFEWCLLVFGFCIF